MHRERWLLLERLFAEALALPNLAREGFLTRACADDSDLCREINELLRSHDAPGVLDATPHPQDAEPLQPSLPAGTCLGPWRIHELIGRGGMGEVYAATRADGAFEQRVALKLLRYEAVGEMRRFHSERRILARLEHPGIARLLDGGTTPDGRPFTVMEYVAGRSLTDYCREHRSSLRERLALFGQICDAVSFAHRNLVIHRDLKPANILVDANGGAKLLDFGIAKLLDAAASTRDADVTIAPFTPDYAAPEQFTGEPVTTATDIYALGVVLFELLTGERLIHTKGLPSTHALKLLLDHDSSRPSRVAKSHVGAPVPMRLLVGDLDAIVAKCLRKESLRRYETVNGLKHDLECHLRKEPVLARSGARMYVFGRLLRRYRWAVTGACALILTLAVGLAGTAWQAQRAERERARATATKDFVLSVFRANDPRIASDKPREEITAKVLLDLGATRIEKEFAGQPELQIELLGLTADLYENLADDKRYAALQKRRIELARAYYGPAHPIVLDGLISEAEATTTRQDYVRAGNLLDEVDAQINSSSQNRSLLRARWWLVKSELLHSANDSQRAISNALDQAIALYGQLAPNSNDYAYVLGLKAIDYGRLEDYARQRRYFEQSLAVLEVAPDRSDSDLQTLLSNFARSLENVGDYPAAERTYVRAEELARKTTGEQQPSYWLARAYHARLLHRHGERERAHALFEQMLQSIPSNWTSTTDDAWARGEYADCLAAEGLAQDAIPILEKTLRSRSERVHGSGLPVWRMDLGDAYDRAGRADDARNMLKSAVDEVLAAAQPDTKKVLTFRERWGRFLLDHASPGDADFADAAEALSAVVALAADRPSVDLALAHAGLARIAAATGDSGRALNESDLALATLAHVQSLYDLRVQAKIWLVHSGILLKRGDGAGSLLWAQKALAASRRYDDPSSPAIAEAEGAVRNAMYAQVKSESP